MNKYLDTRPSSSFLEHTEDLVRGGTHVKTHNYVAERFDELFAKRSQLTAAGQPTKHIDRYLEQSAKIAARNMDTDVLDKIMDQIKSNSIINHLAVGALMTPLLENQPATAAEFFEDEMVQTALSPQQPPSVFSPTPAQPEHAKIGPIDTSPPTIAERTIETGKAVWDGITGTVESGWNTVKNAAKGAWHIAGNVAENVSTGV